jgi:hypothetical protein
LTTKVTTLSVKPGIQRDGTQFASDIFVDGEWVRFQRGLPRQMGGYDGIFLNATGISRGMTMTSTNGLNYVVSGYNNGLEQWSTDNDDRVGLPARPLTHSVLALPPTTITSGNLTLATISTGGGTNQLIAHPGQNWQRSTAPSTPDPCMAPSAALTLAPVGVFTAAGTTNSTTTFTLTTANTAVGAGVSISGSGIPGRYDPVGSVVGTAVTMSAAATASASIHSNL